MDIIKKLLISSIVALLIAIGLDNVAYATELKNSDNVTDTYISDAADSYDTKDNASVEHLEEIGDEENAEDIFDTELYDPDLYEVYVDEQDQVYYIKREPVEQEIEDIDEPTKDDEKEEEVEKKENVKKKDKAEEKTSYSAKDLRLLASLVYSEAGNQSYNGMLAVANVVLNRAKSNIYYHVNTIEEVIYDKQWAVQFSVTIKNKKTGKSIFDRALEAYDSGKFSGKNQEAEKKAMDRAIKAAKAALKGENNIGNYLCFRMNNSGASSIKKKYSDYKILGDHIFYRTK